MTLTTSTVKCSCTDTREKFLHQAQCDLWLDIDFLEGDACWIEATQCLVPLPIDFTLSEEELAARDDAMWAAIAYQYGEDGDDGSTDAETVVDFATPLAMPLECICTVPGTKHCSECGITRNDVNKPWERTMRRVKAEEKQWPLACVCVPEKSWECRKCEVQRSKTGEQWRYWWPSNTSAWVQKCRHYGQAVTLPDGTVVYASSMTNHKEGEAPHFGVYAASSWTPGCIAFTINWQDMGFPKIPLEQLDWALDTALSYAQERDEKVEFGCIGGHGRTGTMLALLVLRTSELDGEAAVKYVRDNYCKEAIEGYKQEWLVRYMHARYNNLPEPEFAPPPVQTWSGSTTVAKSVVQKVVEKVGSAIGLTAGGGWDDLDDWESVELPEDATEEEKQIANGVGAHGLPAHRRLWVEKGEVCGLCKWGPLDADNFARGTGLPTET